MKKSSNQYLSLAVLCLINNLNPVKADQPVHCLKENVLGKWNFTVNKEMEEVNLFETKEICSHRIPNKV
jgi:hypothetical protein